MPVTYLEAIRQGIWEEMERDPDVFLLGEDIGVYGGAFKITAGMLQAFGARRVIDTPLSESAIAGAAIGAALMGLRPVAEMQFADFISCAFDQIVNFAAKCRYRWGAAVPMVVRAPCGAGVHGGPFHSQSNEAWFVHTPGLKVVMPATVPDAKGLIKAAIRDNDPVIFFEHKALYRRIKQELPAGDYTVTIGRASVFRTGRDLSIITYGAMVWVALEAAEVLAEEYKEKIHIHRDYLISGALLHDVGKLFEFAKQEGKFVKSREGELLRHPISGTAFAFQYGLPDEVLHVIAAHSKEGDGSRRSIEAIIVNHADFVNFDIFKG